MVQVNLKLRLTPQYIRVPMTLNQQATKEVPIMAGVVDPHYHREIDLLLHNGVNKNYVRSPGVLWVAS